MLNVSLDYGSCTEEIMLIHTDEVYMHILGSLEEYAAIHNATLIECEIDERDEVDND